MNQILSYLNPIKRLGKTRYSFFFPLILVSFIFIVIEVFVYFVLRDPRAVGNLAIFIPVALILYFSFRDGMKGGFISAILTVLYYVYIIYSRDYKGDELTAGLQTTFVLALLYLLLAGIIGWLKQTIDKLIERETDERRRFQAIVQQLPVGVIVTDNEGRIDFANRRADVILGTKVPVGFKVGSTPFVKVIESRPSPPNQSVLAQALNSGRSIVNEEFVVEKENGKRVYIEASASPIKNKNGKVIAAAEILSDVTEHRELEKRKDDFVNMASHELKTPITSMKLYLDALLRHQKQYDPEKTIKMVKVVRDQTERLQKLVNDLLDVSRLQTGKLSFQKERCNLSNLVETVLSELASVAPDNKLIFSPKSGMWVMADQFRIHQVLTNLITNAIKYSPNTKDIIIKIQKDDKKVTVSVRDFGIGVDKEQQKKIFDRLYQVMDTNQRTFPGLGMGLYISKEIIKRHRGQIWVESEKTKTSKQSGSTFYFSLPISK